MTRFAIDTCSLIALQYSGHLESVIKTADFIITEKICFELEETAKFPDEDGSAARDVMKSIPKITVLDVQPKSAGEEELIEVALLNECDFIVSGDIHAISKLQKSKIPVIFSTHLLYYLYRAGKVSKEEGLFALEKMRNKRTWKQNIIYIAGIQLFR